MAISIVVTVFPVLALELPPHVPAKAAKVERQRHRPITAPLSFLLTFFQTDLDSKLLSSLETIGQQLLVYIAEISTNVWCKVSCSEVLPSLKLP